jgi:hypothetical protein
MIRQSGSEIYTQDKLRTYRLYKRKFQAEPYCTMPMSRGHRSILFKFRCSNLQLSIETGRYVGKAIHERVCTLCTGDLVEDERHVLMNCTAYTDLRFHLVKAAVLLNDSFNNRAEIEQFVFLMNEGRLQHVLSSTLCNMYKRRKMFVCRNSS